MGGVGSGIMGTQEGGQGCVKAHVMGRWLGH